MREGSEVIIFLDTNSVICPCHLVSGWIKTVFVHGASVFREINISQADNLYKICVRGKVMGLWAWVKFLCVFV